MDWFCSLSPMIFLISFVAIQRSESGLEKKTLYIVYIKELDGVPSISLSTRLLVYTILLLAYSKGHTLFLRLVYIECTV